MNAPFISRFASQLAIITVLLAISNTRTFAQVPDAMRGVWKGTISVIHNYVDIKEKHVSSLKIFGTRSSYVPASNHFEFYFSNLDTSSKLTQVDASLRGSFEIPIGAAVGSNAEFNLPYGGEGGLRGIIAPKSLKFTTDTETGKMNSLSLKFIDERNLSDEGIAIGRVVATVTVTLKRLGPEID